jgi:hypothetical protein
LKDTIGWRSSFFPVCPKHVFPECVTGKNYLNGFDVHGHPVLYLKPRHENTSDPERQIAYLVFMLECAIKIMPQVSCSDDNQATTSGTARIQQIVLVMDFCGMTLKNQPSLSTSKRVVDILSRHYPERLHKAFILHAPGFFHFSWRVLSPFLHPVTKQKICFVQGSEFETYFSRLNKTKHHEEVVKDLDGLQQLFDSIPREMLEKAYGGHFDFEFHAETYWKTLLESIR